MQHKTDKELVFLINKSLYISIRKKVKCIKRQRQIHSERKKYKWPVGIPKMFHVISNQINIKKKISAENFCLLEIKNEKYICVCILLYIYI